jgi:hypothetical protein
MRMQRVSQISGPPIEQSVHRNAERGWQLREAVVTPPKVPGSIIEAIRELDTTHASAVRCDSRSHRAAARCGDALRDLVDHRALSDDDRTLDWSVRAGNQDRRVGVESKLMLLDPRVRRSRWEDLGRLIVEPVKAIEREHQQPNSASATAHKTRIRS